MPNSLEACHLKDLILYMLVKISIYGNQFMTKNFAPQKFPNIHYVFVVEWSGRTVAVRVRVRARARARELNFSHLFFFFCVKV